MIQINNKYEPGQEVWRVHCYPAGAKIFHGKVKQIHIFVTEHGINTFYEFYDGFKTLYTEDKIFITEEEALKYKEGYCEMDFVKENTARIKQMPKI